MCRIPASSAQSERSRVVDKAMDFQEGRLIYTMNGELKGAAPATAPTTPVAAPVAKMPRELQVVEADDEAMDFQEGRFIYTMDGELKGLAARWTDYVIDKSPPATAPTTPVAAPVAEMAVAATLEHELYKCQTECQMLRDKLQSTTDQLQHAKDHAESLKLMYRSAEKELHELKQSLAGHQPSHSS